MRRYKVEHPRKIRGAGKEEETKYKAGHPSKTRGAGKEEVSEEPLDVDSLLVPDQKHYVETPEIKGYKERAMKWIEAGYPVHLIGPTGCGKSTLGVRVAEELNEPVVWMNGDEQLDTTNLVGDYTKMKEEYVADKFIHNVHKGKRVKEPKWVSNPLKIAVENGWTLVYNEFSRAPPEANNALLSIFEEGILELPTKFGKDRYIDVPKEFKAILVSNSTEYAGVHRPQDALLDRLATIFMRYYNEKTEKEIVQEHCPTISESRASEIVRVIRTLRENGNQENGVPGTRACIMVGKALEVSEDPNFPQLVLDSIANKQSREENLEKKFKEIKSIINDTD